VSDLVLDASLALQWFLEDEADRKYSLAILGGLYEKRALVPFLWFYEVGNGLLMAYRRKRNLRRANARLPHTPKSASNRRR
jgi:predicted nucleic acid-binding protein